MPRPRLRADYQRQAARANEALRDQFAMHALPTLISISVNSPLKNLKTKEDCARMAYDCADAMLVERSIRTPQEKA